MTIDEIMSRASVIPVLEVSDLNKGAPLAKALFSGGLEVIELTLRTDCALEALAEMKSAEPNLIIGMGTIRSVDDIEKSIAAGADFLVSPGASSTLLAALWSSGVPALPGVATASEVMTASEVGFQALKFFPAEAAGGIAYLKSLAGPLPEIAFCPTGGVSASLAPDYLALDNVDCVGGSWIANKDMIARGDWDAITRNAQLASHFAAPSV